MATKKIKSKTKKQKTSIKATTPRKKSSQNKPSSKQGKSTRIKTKPKSKIKTKSKVKTEETKIRKRKISSKASFSQESFPIVGIGASAGGLEAFEDFFSQIDSETGMAFVIVTHQHPGYVSALPEIIGKFTGMELLTIKDGMQVRQNCVYLIPSGVNLAIFNKSLHLIKTEGMHGSQLPIDFFFRSLAEDQKDKAVGIILSGTGTDGTLGLRAIKGESGMIIVQDNKSAKFSGMPQSAIDTGLVDYILPPGGMAKQLLKYVKGPFLSSSPPGIKLEVLQKNGMEKIFLQLRQHTGHDFSCYKSSTIRRRIERRMNIHHIPNPTSYVRFLQANPQESELLFKDLLISVTGFFRNVEAFKFLSTKVLPKYLESKPQGNPLRIWVPGCASGEEAYSLSILLRECIHKLNLHLDYQVFATDLDLHAIDIARAGFYPEGIAADVGKQRLRNFFQKEDDGYRIRKDIRETVVFAPHNVFKDPPFTKLDMISCRNLLIYLKPEIQKKIFDLFYYAIKPGGILFLGTSETIGTQSHLFKPSSKNFKIFVREKSDYSAQTQINEMTTDLTIGLPKNRKKPIKTFPLKGHSKIPGAAKRVFLKYLTPPSLIINHQGNIIFIHGEVSPFIEMHPGQPSNNVLLMAREGLKVELISAMRHCKDENQKFSIKNIPVKNTGDIVWTDLTVQKISDHSELNNLLLVAFRPSESRSKPVEKTKTKSKKQREEEDRLRLELQYTKEILQGTNEELEATNEELKSTSEEVQSTNEELQSSNEELETSKEEMQSLNEELQTTNIELQSKVDELTHANNDIKNLLDKTEIATLFLDDDLKIKRFTTAIIKMINLIDSDLGRPLSDFSFNFDYQYLIKDCERVVKTLIPVNKEVQTPDGAWSLMRIIPYRTTENRIEGLILTFIDINQMKKTKFIMDESKDARRLATIIRDSNDAITVQSFDGKILEWNRGAQKIYGYSEREARKMTANKLIPKGLHIKMKKMSQSLSKGKTIKPFITQRITKKGKVLKIFITATALKNDDNSVYAFATTERDIGEINIKLLDES